MAGKWPPWCHSAKNVEQPLKKYRGRWFEVEEHESYFFLKIKINVYILFNAHGLKSLVVWRHLGGKAIILGIWLFPYSSYTSQR